jgi:hypothetical protein
VRDDLRVHVALADAARDELCVLRTEVHHENGVKTVSRVHLPSLGHLPPLTG